MAELKPCPFCGRIPMVEDCGDNRFFVRCKCGIAQDKLYGQRCDAVRRWNTRKPSADVQPVRHGKWIIEDNPGTGWYRVTCSECGEDVTSVVPVIGFFPNAKVIWDFCPDCGARMDGEA